MDKRLSQSTTGSVTELTLYHHEYCVYCHWVRDEIENLKIECIELRDIRKQPEFAKELREEGGKQQVPCLKISRQGQVDEWLYESRLIIRFVKQNMDLSD